MGYIKPVNQAQKELSPTQRREGTQHRDYGNLSIDRANISN